MSRISSRQGVETPADPDGERIGNKGLRRCTGCGRNTVHRNPFDMRDDCIDDLVLHHRASLARRTGRNLAWRFLAGGKAGEAADVADLIEAGNNLTQLARARAAEQRFD